MKLVILASLALLSVASGSPVEKVVDLLKSLKAKTTGDGKAEQQTYDKYACWCETTSARKASDIVQAQADLRSLGQRILKLKGTVATRAAEIAELTEKIKSNEEEQETLTAVRGKQNAAWAAESAEVKQALAALQEAISVLSKATTPGKAGLLQVNQMMAKHAVRSVMDSLPSKLDMPPSRMALLEEFMSAKAGYAPQSATIQGMLGDMYLTFSNNLESDTLQEANQNHDFEKTYASLESSNNKMKKTRQRKETEKAEAEAMLADTTKAYDDTEQQMGADTKFFDVTKAACESKSAEWTLRTKMRNSELDGINAALDLLTSDKARELFATAIKPGVGFLQLSSDNNPALLQDSANAPAARAYNALKSQVRKSHSVRLAALAVEIRTAKAGHFDAVIGAIDKMLNTLNEEGAADLAKKTQCLDQYQQIGRTVNDLDWKVKNNEAQIEKFEQLIELRTGEKEDTIQKKKETNQYIADISKQRKEEHDEYNQAKKDDEAAKKLLEQAKEAFAKFYKENGIKMLQEPEFTRSADAAPDAKFTDKGTNKLESKGIISLFDYIIEDITDELANSKKAEMTSQAEFEEEKKTAETLVDELDAKITTLTGIIAKRNEDKTAENKDMKENNRDRDAELAYKKKVTPDCDWIIKAFDGRAEARAAEMSGLTTAKELLAGMPALIETKFDDASLKSIRFLGISH